MEAGFDCIQLISLNCHENILSENAYQCRDLFLTLNHYLFTDIWEQ